MALSNQDKKDIKQIVERQVDDNNQKIEQMFIKFRSDFYDKIDPILKEVVASREERTIVAEKLSNHEDRIEKLEQAAA